MTKLHFFNSFSWSVSVDPPATCTFIFISDISPHTWIFIFLFVFPALLFIHRSKLTWRTQPSTTSSAPSSSRWSATWGSLVLRRWACPAPASPLTTGACRQGQATVPPTALWPYWPSTLTARKRWAFIWRVCVCVAFICFPYWACL